MAAVSADPLDRAIWSALTTRRADLAERHGDAVRFLRAIGSLAATADGSAEGLAPLIGAGEALLLIEADMPQPVDGLVLEPRAAVQMILALPPPAPAEPPGWRALGEAAAADMLALATLTAPGPFFAETWRLGGFIGVREEGRLVAMAGERLRLPGHSEVTGICTHPQARGRGLARVVTGAVIARIVARGETPILHANADNGGALALYRALGFVLRREFVSIAVTRAS